MQKAGEIRDHEGILSVQVADDQLPKHDSDGIKKSENDEKGKKVEVETSHLERRSSIRQGRMLVELNKIRKKES